MSQPAGRQLFAQLASLPDDQIDLGLAALLIAEEEYPELDRARYLARLDELGVLAADRLNPSMDADKVTASLAQLLADQEGFRGNSEDYYDPRNSFLNDVLDRRTGIPITLSILYMEVGRRAGLDVRGVGFPAHFLVKYVAPNGRELLLDPFGGGAVVDEDECRRRLAELSSGVVELQPEFLASTSPKQILVRMLNNLKHIYLQARYYRKAVGIIDRLLALQPNDYRQLRDRGAIYAELKQFDQARADLRAFLDRAHAGDGRQAVRQAIENIDRLATLMD